MSRAEHADQNDECSDDHERDGDEERHPLVADLEVIEADEQVVSAELGRDPVQENREHHDAEADGDHDERALGLHQPLGHQGFQIESHHGSPLKIDNGLR